MIFTRRPQTLPVELRALGTLLIVMLIARFGSDSLPRQVPFLPFLEWAGSGEQWIAACKYAFMAGAALVLTGVAIQAGCLLAGLALVLKVLGNMPQYSNGRLFDGLILLLIGLYTPGSGLRFLRVQCYLLYIGAVLGKVIDPDWWNGRFVDAMLAHHLPAAWRAFLQPATAFAGWLTMGAESACAVLLMRPNWRWAGVLTVALFHTTLLLLLSEDFGSFYYTVALCAVLLFLPLRPVECIAAPSARWAFLPRHAAFAALREAPFKVGAPMVRFRSMAYTGWRAMVLLALMNLPVQAVVLGGIAFLSKRGYGHTRDFFIGAGLATALLVWRLRDKPYVRV